jgi:plastocyanin
MTLHKVSFVTGGLAVILAACATATPEPAPDPTAAPLPTQEEEIAPSVTVGDQDASNGTVIIEKVTAGQAGWLVIHITTDGAPGAVIGQAPVSEGSNEDVEVAIDLSQATPQLFAMLHLDAGIEGEYEFPGDDVPVFVDEVIVNVPFQVEFPLEESEVETAEGEVVEVEVIDSTYLLKVTTVPVGTTVTFVYNGGLPHTVTSDADLFNSGTLGEGDTFSFTFDEAGTFPYFCRFHGGPGGSGMSGVVEVTEG